MTNRAMSVTGPPSTSGSAFYYGYAVVIAASVSMVLIFSVHYAFGVFFKPLSSEFGWSRAQTSGAFSLVWIVQGLLSAVMGGLNDKLGPRIVVTICGLLAGTGYLLISQITAIWQLYLLYALVVGAGLGGLFVPLTSTTARWFIARRGLMTGIVTAGVGGGAVIGPLIANWLIRLYQWRRAYIIMGGLALAVATSAAQFLKRDPAQIGEKPYGENEVVRHTSQLAGLSLQEALGSWQLWLASVVFFCYGFTLSAILLHLTPHATDLGISPTDGATLLAALGASSIVGKVLLGVTADRIGNKKVYLVSFLLTVASLVWLIRVSHLPALYVFALAFGFAYGGLAAAHSPLVAWLFGMRQHGLIFGVCFNGWTIGCALGPLAAGYIFDVTHSYRMAFVICTVVSLIGFILTMYLKPGGFQRSSTGTAFVNPDYS